MCNDLFDRRANHRDIINTYFVSTSTLDLRVTAYASGAHALFRGTKVTRSSAHKKWFKKKLNFWEIRMKFAYCDATMAINFEASTGRMCRREILWQIVILSLFLSSDFAELFYIPDDTTVFTLVKFIKDKSR